MYPPSTPGQYGHIDLSALSGIAGSISIACWIVVFSPQIIENFRRGSADGLSITFIIIWLAGDVFNILGAVMQGVLPTMIILAVYYTLADIVLLGQVWYYRGFTWKDAAEGDGDQNGTKSPRLGDEERRPLLNNGQSNGQSTRQNGAPPMTAQSAVAHFDRPRTGSSGSHRQIDGTRLSPATPFIDHPPQLSGFVQAGSGDSAASGTTDSTQKKTSALKTAGLNTFAVLLVCAAGVLGWYISKSSASSRHHRQHSDHKKSKEQPEPMTFDTWGQIFGYLCAFLYLGSRVPQLLLNYRRKSTEGISLLFFLFACIGNLTYVLSIFAYDATPSCRGSTTISETDLHALSRHSNIHTCAPGEAGQIYARYLAVNASWILGSLGTLGLDMAIFVQFFLYRVDGEDEDESVIGSEDDYDRDDVLVDR